MEQQSFAAEAALKILQARFYKDGPFSDDPKDFVIHSYIFFKDPPPRGWGKISAGWEGKWDPQTFQIYNSPKQSGSQNVIEIPSRLFFLTIFFSKHLIPLMFYYSYLYVCSSFSYFSSMQWKIWKFKIWQILWRLQMTLQTKCRLIESLGLKAESNFLGFTIFFPLSDRSQWCQAKVYLTWPEFNRDWTLDSWFWLTGIWDRSCKISKMIGWMGGFWWVILLLLVSFQVKSFKFLSPGGASIQTQVYFSVGVSIRLTVCHKPF